jgi:hypothetical protein
MKLFNKKIWINFIKIYIKDEINKIIIIQETNKWINKIDK